MMVPARVSFVTLVVRDLPRMAAFYRSLGWPESTRNNERHVAFRCGGAILGLFGAENYEKTFGMPPEGGEFKGFTLAVNLDSPEAVDEAYEALAKTEGAALHGEPQDSFLGRGFVFSDPEGNVWDVIWAKGTSIDERGGLVYP
jgi:hypothetical protein